MNHEISPDGLPLADRLLIAALNWAAAHLSLMGRIRLRHHLVRERGTLGTTR